MLKWFVASVLITFAQSNYFLVKTNKDKTFLVKTQGDKKANKDLKHGLVDGHDVENSNLEHEVGVIESIKRENISDAEEIVEGFWTNVVTSTPSEPSKTSKAPTNKKSIVDETLNEEESEEDQKFSYGDNLENCNIALLTSK